ncbi:MAG: FAD-dependent monooxygenase [Planctomycetes bacterium]|nr:FAD-dependent monooxygenase [Planctomycetota bacterium]
MKRIAIVGGGPAGSAAATLLARAGHDVTLFERQAAPRERVCGEFLSGEALPLLARLGVEPAGWPIRRARVFGGAGKGIEAELPRGGGIGWERTHLDPALRAAAVRAGARLVTADVKHMEAGLVDGAALDAVVDATGRFPLSRGAGAPLAGFGYRAAFEGPVPDAAVELHLFPGGYVGLAGVAPRRANLCLLAPRDLARRHAGELDALLDDIRARSPSLRSRLAASRRATDWCATGYPRSRFAGCHARGIWYAGDAAGTVAPLGGEGIAMALGGGALLADHFDRGPASFTRAWQDEFARRLRWCRALSALAIRPLAARAALAVLTRVPGLVRTIVAATRS